MRDMIARTIGPDGPRGVFSGIEPPVARRAVRHHSPQALRRGAGLRRRRRAVPAASRSAAADRRGVGQDREPPARLSSALGANRTTVVRASSAPPRRLIDDHPEARKHERGACCCGHLRSAEIDSGSGFRTLGRVATVTHRLTSVRRVGGGPDATILPAQLPRSRWTAWCSTRRQPPPTYHRDLDAQVDALFAAAPIIPGNGHVVRRADGGLWIAIGNDALWTIFGGVD